MKRHTLIAAALVALCVILGNSTTARTADETRKSTDALLASCQIPKDGDAIVLPLSVGQKQVLFFLDTGASGTLVDLSLRSVLGEYVATETMGTLKDEVLVNCYESPELSLGNLRLQMGKSVACMSLTGFGSAAGRNIRGVLGRDCLEHYIVQIDWDAGELRLYSPAVQPDSGWGSVFFMDYPRASEIGGGRLRRPTVSVSIDGVRVPFMIDTGASVIGIDNELIRNLRNNHELGNLASAAQTMTFGGNTVAAGYAMKSFSLGPFEHKNLICSHTRWNLLGLSYLSRYRVTLDFPHRRLYLKKGRRYQEADRDDMSGLHILREDNSTVVKIVDSDSPAARADIRPGDRLLRIDGQEAAKISLFDLRNMLKSGNGKKITLTIARADKQEDKTIELKEILPQWDSP
jgi:hypothetical protein